MTHRHSHQRHKHTQSQPQRFADLWTAVSLKWMPFADAVSDSLPLGRLMRLSLFQMSIGMALVLLNATLNRVMIVELGVSAALVSTMIALPVLFAPLRVLIGHRTDHHRSFLGWRRVPYMWFGTLLQYGGLAIMPFALLVLTGDADMNIWMGTTGAALAFLMIGAGIHTTQTSGLALAADLSAPDKQPRILAFLYTILLLSMGLFSLILGWALADFSQIRLIQVIQGCAVLTMVLNFIALWKQEGRTRSRLPSDTSVPSLREVFATLRRAGSAGRLLVAVALGAAAFGMQEVLLEPYGGDVMGLSVSETTQLTAILSLGTFTGFVLAARMLGRGAAACQIAAIGALLGVVAFPTIIVADAMLSSTLFRSGCVLIGLGSGLFLIGTLTAAMDMGADTGDRRPNAIPGQQRPEAHGLALGAWGAVQAGATGAAIFAGGFLRDAIAPLALSGQLGPVLSGTSTPYLAVYAAETVLIFATLIAIGPLVRHDRVPRETLARPVGLAHFPGI